MERASMREARGGAISADECLFYNIFFFFVILQVVFANRGDERGDICCKFLQILMIRWNQRVET